jgi:multiple sugar transport system permease protein
VADDAIRPSASTELDRARRSAVRAEALVAWSLAGPAAFLLVLLLLGPTVMVVLMSFTDWLFGAAGFAWVGLDNYAEIARDRIFWISVRNTFVYVGIVTPLAVGIGLGVALLIEAGTSFRSFYRAAFFLPVASTLIAMSIVWEFLLHPTVGAINVFARALGFSGTHWLQNPDTVLPALALIGVWQAVGLNMVLFLAGIKSIPRDLYDASAIDGVDSAWERFRRVTWPMLGPAAMFVVLITAIRSFQVFDSVQVLTQGGPARASEVLLYSIYTQAFSYLRAANAAALTVVFLAIVVSLTLLQARVMDRRVHYT